MRIWSIQSVDAWEHLQRHGHLLAKQHHRSDAWPDAYDWMRDQLSRRVGPPDHETVEPLWGWYQWSGPRKRPDLRCLRHHWEPEGPHVMIECELPDDQVLLSDYGAWHIPLNDGYLGLGDQDEERFDLALQQAGWKRGDPLPGLLLTEQRKSWELIFDLEALDSDDWGRIGDKSIQACFWRIDLHQVRLHKPFISKLPKYW